MDRWFGFRGQGVNGIHSQVKSDMNSPDLGLVPVLTPVAFDASSSCLPGVAGLYAETWNKQRKASRKFVLEYAESPGFVGRVLQREGRVVGMGFGTSMHTGNWWFDCVARQLGDQHPALQDAWVLAELALKPSYRNRGLGGEILDSLFAEVPHAQALLSSGVGNTGARRFYERRGWTVLHPGFAFAPFQSHYLVMHRELGA